MDVSKAVLTRRTIRRFKNIPIKFSILKELVNAGRLAPSAANLQPVEFVVVDKKSQVERIFPYLRWAGYIAPIGNPPEGKRPVSYIVVLINEKKAKLGFGSHDAAASIMNIILSAWGRGIGCCWIQSFEEPAIRKILKAPSFLKIDSIIALGYKDEEPVVEDFKGSVRYWKDKDGVLHVPKRPIKDVLHRNIYHMFLGLPNT